MHQRKLKIEMNLLIKSGKMYEMIFLNAVILKLKLNFKIMITCTFSETSTIQKL